MKFVISSSVLSAHLQTIGRVIVQKNNMPILDCFCMDIKGKTLTVTAADSDTTMTTSLDLVECDSDIRFAVNAKILQDSIKEIPEQPLEIYVKPETLEITVQYQNGHYTLVGQSADEYPVPAADEGQKATLVLDGQRLLTGVNRAIMAAANDVMRPTLNSVCFDMREGNVAIVASNGSHLALTKYALSSETAEGTFLLGTRPAGLLRGILNKEEGDVVVTFGERRASFSTAEYTLDCLLVDGRYPNYNSVIPQDNPNIVTLNRQALISALRRVLVFATPATALVKLGISASSLNITTEDLDFNKSAQEDVLCEYAGDPMRIAFKGSTLLELVQNIECDDIMLRLADRSRAGVIVPAQQKEGEEVLMLIMPSVFTD